LGILKPSLLCSWPALCLPFMEVSGVIERSFLVHLFSGVWKW
jgi:hypothetical protein